MWSVKRTLLRVNGGNTRWVLPCLRMFKVRSECLSFLTVLNMIWQSQLESEIDLNWSSMRVGHYLRVA